MCSSVQTNTFLYFFIQLHSERLFRNKMLSKSKVLLRVGSMTPSSQRALSTQSKPSRTCLFNFHVRHGGKMVDFAGFEMPVQYADQTIQQSHLFTRDKCSLFDVSHMMQSKVYGKDRFKFIESLVVADVLGLKPDCGSLTVFTNKNGGIIDDLIVSSTSLDYLYIVSNAGCAEKDLKHLRECERTKKAEKFDVSLSLIEDYGLLALQGPRMHDVLQPGVSFDLKTLPFMSTRETRVFSFENCRVTRCGYTGEDGVEISVPKKYAESLAEKLLEAKGKDGEPLCKVDIVKPFSVGIHDSSSLINYIFHLSWQV